MTINKTITGFCPTLNRDNSIELTYEIIEKAGKCLTFFRLEQTANTVLIENVLSD